MRDVYNAVRKSQRSLVDYSSKMKNAIDQGSNFRKLAVQIQDKEISMQILRQEIAQARRRLRNTQLRFSAVMEKLTENESEKTHRISDLEELIKKVDEFSIQNGELRKSYLLTLNELVLRQRYMIYELYRIFFARSSQQQHIFKNRCCCKQFDEIRGLHLPQIKCLTGHSDLEIAAALGAIVCLLQIFSRIVGYPMRHTLCFIGSRSTITSRIRDETFPLYPVASRKQKERQRFDIALQLLNEVICEFRTQAGIATTDMDRPIYQLKEMLLACIGVVRPAMSRSPRKSLSIMVQLACPVDNAEAVSDNENNINSDFNINDIEFANRMVKFLCVNEVANALS